MQPDDQTWGVIERNDTALDGKLWYAVSSTKIFCKPSCHSRLPKRQNVSVYQSFQDAMAAGYRPCKRCRPTEEVVADDIWVDEINYILEQDYAEKLTLEELAFRVHGSESHVRHVYQKHTGVTPLQKLNAIRMAKARTLLEDTPMAIDKVGETVGIANTSYFIKLFKQHFHLSPYQYRLAHS